MVDAAWKALKPFPSCLPPIISQEPVWLEQYLRIAVYIQAPEKWYLVYILTELALVALGLRAWLLMNSPSSFFMR